MLVLSPLSRKERFWTAGVAAFAMHSLMIAAVALTINYPQGSSPQDFHVEVMFASSIEKGSSDVSTSPLKGEIVAEQSISKVNVSKSSQKSVRKKPNTSPLLSGDSQSSGEASVAFPIFNPPPLYPKEARRKKIEGVVMVRASLREDGGVAGAISLPPGIDPLLETAALRAIHQWRFKPGVRVIEVPIEFKLES